MKKKVETNLQENTGGTVPSLAQRKLYIRFPEKVPPAKDVMQLSPAIISVCYPRQKSTRFCHIILESEAAVPEVLKFLNKKKYNNGHLIVEIPRKLQYIQTEQELNVSGVTEQKKENTNGKDINTHKINDTLLETQNNASGHCKNERKVEQYSGGKYVLKKQRVKTAAGGNNDRRLWMKKLPFNTDRKELVAAFPGCIWARVYKTERSKSSRAICKFSTAQQAASIMADHKKHQFKGQDILIELAESQQLRSVGKGKKSVQKHNKQAGDTKGQQSVAKLDEQESTLEKLEETVGMNFGEVMDIQESEESVGDVSKNTENENDDSDDNENINFNG